MSKSLVIKRWALPVLGVVLVVGGVVLSASQPASFGWFANAPVPSPFAVIPPGGAAMLAIGVVLIAGWVGFRLGRRTP